MGKKSFYILTAFILIGIAAFSFFVLERKETEPIKVSTPEKIVNVGMVRTEIPEEKRSEFSIPAFSEKQFNCGDFQTGEVLDNNSFYTRYFITYRSGDLKISGIMNVPKGAGPFPVLFLNHGYIDPEIYTNGRGLKREQDYLARRGYIVIHSDYRNHAQSDKEADPKRPDLRFGYAEDVICAVKSFAAANYSYADNSKIGMLGHSMGGGVAEIIAIAQPDLVRAFVLFAPVSADQKDNYEKWTKDDPERQSLTEAQLGTPEMNPKLWDEASPINYFNRVKSPIVIHHGMADKDCAIGWSERATEILKKEGKDATLYFYPGEPHEFSGAWPTVMQRTVQFYDNFAKK